MSSGIKGDQIKDGTICRIDLNTTTIGQAVITKVVQGQGIIISSTGADSGTGDVTITNNFTTSGGNNGTATTVSRGDHIHANVTTSVNGFMSATDKSKLNGLMSSITATVPATVGWYRIATSPASISRCAARFEIDWWTVSGFHGQVILNAGIMFAQTPTLNMIQYTSYGGGLQIARIVYNSTYSGNYAYLEVYNPGATSLLVTVQMFSSLGWTLVTPSTPGGIPSGYTNLTLQFHNGISTTGQLSSSVATGTSPLIVSSTTLVNNLNSEYLGGKLASDFNKVLTGTIHITDFSTFNPSSLNLSVGDIVTFEGNSALNRPGFTITTICTGTIQHVYSDHYVYFANGGAGATYNRQYAIGAFNGGVWRGWQLYTAQGLLDLIKTVDGSASGLDSDYLEGQHGAYYLDYNNLTNKPTIPSAYSLPLAANGTRGGIQIGYSPNGVNLPLFLSSEKGYISLTSSAITSALGFTPIYGDYLPINGGAMNGDLVLTTDITFNLGDSGKRWKNIYAYEVYSTSFHGYLDGNASSSNQANILSSIRTLTIGNTGKGFNGSANVSWSLSEIGATPVQTSTTNSTTYGSLSYSFVNNNVTTYTHTNGITSITFGTYTQNLYESSIIFKVGTGGLTTFSYPSNIKRVGILPNFIVGKIYIITIWYGLLFIGEHE